MNKTCRSCGATITWHVTASGRPTPVDPDGTPHWATCPNAAKHRKPRPAQLTITDAEEKGGK